jgi:hypothetical protein
MAGVTIERGQIFKCPICDRWILEKRFNKQKIIINLRDGQVLIASIMKANGAFA